jgi:hypothetical protein
MRTKTVLGIKLTQDKDQWGDIYYTGELNYFSFKIIKCGLSVYRNGYSEWDGRKTVLGYRAYITRKDGSQQTRDHYTTLNQSIKDLLFISEYYERTAK